MQYKTDIEIAQSCELKPITEIAATAHVDEKYIEQYGRYKAKIDLSLLKETEKEDGKLILSPENPRFAPMVYVKEELNSVKIIGKAVAFQSFIV